MKYYVVIGHKDAAGDWIEILERDDEYKDQYTKLGAHTLFYFLDMHYGEGVQYGDPSKTQEAWLIGRHRFCRMIDFGNLGYQFVKTYSSDIKRIQFPEKIVLSFDKSMGYGSKATPQPWSDLNRVDIEFPQLDEQITQCFDKDCSIDPMVFQLSEFDNYGDVYIDLSKAERYADFTKNLDHFITFMKNYPNSSLYFVCSSDKEAELKKTLKEKITSHHLTNYIEFCDAKFDRRSPKGGIKSGLPNSEYDTFSETIEQFFDENTFNANKEASQKTFYQVPFKLAKITLNAGKPWSKYTSSPKFIEFLKHNSNIKLEIDQAMPAPGFYATPAVSAEEIAQFILANKITAHIYLSSDPQNSAIINAIAANRQELLKGDITKHQLDQLKLVPELKDNGKYRLNIEKYLGNKLLGLNQSDVQNEDVDMGQNQNQNQNQNQQMMVGSAPSIEPPKLVVSSKSSIPDVKFEANQPLLEQLIGFQFEAKDNSPNAPQIEKNIKKLFGDMKGIIDKSDSSKACYCPLSYSVDELLPGAFYVSKDKLVDKVEVSGEIIKAISHPNKDFDKNKNTLFFSPPYASIAIKKDKYAFKLFNRPVDTQIQGAELLNEVKGNEFVQAFLNDTPDAGNKQKLQILINKLFKKRGAAGIELFTKSLHSLKLKNPEIYQNLFDNFIMTSQDLSEIIENPGLINTLTSLGFLKDKQRMNWWTAIIQTQCKNNPNFDLNHLFNQFTGFWLDLDKLQNFLPIPDKFPFVDFADAGITLGKMYRIMSNAKNRFEQIASFKKGNISHAYMMYDLFDSSLYTSKMDGYASILVRTLTAENAFNKKELKKTYFSLNALKQQIQNPDLIDLNKFRSYLWSFASINGNTLKDNNSDIAFYKGVLNAIDQKAADLGLNEVETKTFYATIMLFVAFGNNSSLEQTMQDIEDFSGIAKNPTLWNNILNYYSAAPQSDYFMTQNERGKMVNSDAMLSFHTMAKLAKHPESLKIMTQCQNWAINNKGLTGALQKIINESTAKGIASFDSQPAYLTYQNEDTTLGQSILLIAMEINPACLQHSAELFNQYQPQLAALSQDQLILLNKVFLDINLSKSKRQTLFSSPESFKEFLIKAESLVSIDDYIFLAQHYKLELSTLHPSEEGLLTNIKSLENAPQKDIQTYKKQYQQLLTQKLKKKSFNAQRGHDFSDKFLIKMDLNDNFLQLKSTYENLLFIIENSKDEDLLKTMQVLQTFDLSTTNPYHLTGVTSTLLQHLPLIENIELFLISIKDKGANQKLGYLHTILEQIIKEPSSFENLNKKELNKKTLTQIQASLDLLKNMELVDELTSNKDIKSYLEFLEAAASPVNLNTSYVKDEFSTFNRIWNELTQKYPNLTPSLLKIAQFNIGLFKGVKNSDAQQIEFIAKVCANETLLNSKKNGPLDPKYKEQFTKNLNTLLGFRLDLNAFYSAKQLSHPSLENLLKLLQHYNNDVKKAHHHYEKDPAFSRPHKKATILKAAQVTDKNAAYLTTSFDMSKQNKVVDAITKGYQGVERSTRKNLLLQFSHYINEIGYKTPVFASKVDGKKVPVRKLSDEDLKTALNKTKAELDKFRPINEDTIWQNKKYQRTVCKLLAVVRESMFRFGHKNAYSTQMDAVLMAIMSGDYSYAMQINTGEGKALIATFMAVALQLITNKQVVVTTSNMSLANRDAATYNKFINWFDISHETIASTTKNKAALNAKIIHSTQADFALCHDKDRLIDNSNRLYLHDEWDYTIAHLMPAINSQSKVNEKENWWIYEEILDYVAALTKESAKQSPEVQVNELVRSLKVKFHAELQKLETAKARKLNGIKTSGKPDSEKAAELYKLEKEYNPNIMMYKNRVAKLNLPETPELFNALIDSAIIAYYVFKDGVSYAVVDHIQDGKKLKKVVPVENGKPLTEGDIMYMYGIHQFLIQRSIKEKPQFEFLKPAALESTTYFNNYSTQAGCKSIGLTGTVPNSQYEIYKALVNEGRSTIIPPHQENIRKDAVLASDFAKVTPSSSNVFKTEEQLVDSLAQQIQAHDGAALIYCKDKNECEAREKALNAKLKAQGYTVQIVINGITEDFTEGEQLTSRGKQAQRVKTVTLTVGDGRGIDLKSEGKDKLLSVCSFVPETAEQIAQIYGRAGRNGEAGKSALLLLQSELNAYGQNFANLQDKFNFLDKVRTRQYDFAIKKIGYLQYEVQQQIKNAGHKITVIGFMDNLYNKLLLEAVVAKVRQNIANKINNLQIQGRWEPFLMLNDTDLSSIYQKFCDGIETKLVELNIQNINVNQIKTQARTYTTAARDGISKEADALKGPTSNSVRSKLSAYPEKIGQKLAPATNLTLHRDSILNRSISIIAKTTDLMERFVDGHLGMYGFDEKKIALPAYQKIAQLLTNQKEKVKQLTSDVYKFHLNLACEKALETMEEDNLKELHNLLNIIDKYLKNVLGQDPTVEKVKQSIVAHFNGTPLDKNTIATLKRALTHNNLDEVPVVNQCVKLHQELVDGLSASQAELNTLAAEKLADSDFTTLYSLLSMGSVEERNSESTQALIKKHASSINAALNAYNDQAKPFNALMGKKFACQSCLNIDSTATRVKKEQYKELNLLDVNHKNISAIYQNYKKAVDSLAALKQELKTEQVEVTRLEQQASKDLELKIKGHGESVKELQGVLTEQRNYLLAEDVVNYDHLKTTFAESDILLRAREVAYSIGEVKDAVKKERAVLDQAKKSADPRFVEFKKVISVLQDKMKQFKLKSEELEKPKTKSKELLAQIERFKTAYNATETLYKDLEIAGKKYFKTGLGEQDYTRFKTTCDASIKTASKVLDQHRGWFKKFINVLAIILTGGVGYLIAAGFDYAINGRSTFWATDSSNKIHGTIQRFIDKKALPQGAKPTSSLAPRAASPQAAAVPGSSKISHAHPSKVNAVPVKASTQQTVNRPGLFNTKAQPHAAVSAEQAPVRARS